MSKELTGLPNTPEEIRAFIGKDFVSLRFGQENEQPHENDTYTLTAHDLISAFQWSEIDAPISAEPLGMSLEIRTLGNYGAAYDPPGKRRAYTYEHQPGNIKASRLGSACLQAAAASAGDTIDRGLGLLRELQAQGFGVFDAQSSRWHAAPAATQPDVTQQTLDDVMAGIPARDAEIAALRKQVETLQAQLVDKLTEMQRYQVDESPNLQSQQQPVSGADGLPPLPEAAFPGVILRGHKSIPRYLFTATQMKDYARAALAQQDADKVDALNEAYQRGLRDGRREGSDFIKGCLA
ncbi:hypothetical protein [Alcaligenes aquatilis]|uniref:hypothetical protein n=1 Tax=Alcaligenes aquatilis TaxID=323284 RepID=UPI00361E0C74